MICKMPIGCQKNEKQKENGKRTPVSHFRFDESMCYCLYVSNERISFSFIQWLIFLLLLLLLLLQFSSYEREH